MAEITLTNNNFKTKIINSEIPVLVDFWAAWCGPCRMLAPIIDEVAKEYEGKVKVGKVNVDEEQELAVRYGIASIPTVILFKNGAIANKTIGFGSKAQITDMLK